MQESQPPIENGEAKLALAKRLHDTAIEKSIHPEDEVFWENIVKYIAKFKEDHPNYHDYLLYHALAGSGPLPEKVASMPLDTPDGQLEKFIKEELAKLG